jgi:hypothetical protein
MKIKQCITLVFLFYLSSCNLDTNKNLQIDQSFEGEEAYWVSQILNENSYLAFYDVKVFADIDFTDELPGCPSVSISENEMSVTLDYDNPACEEASDERKGKLVLEFGDNNAGEGDLRKIRFDGYQINESKIEGYRMFQVANHMMLNETTDSLLLIDENGSSTRLILEMEHEGKIQQQKVTEVISNGNISGRNWSGNQLDIMISTAKITRNNCEVYPHYNPISGEESWTIYRSEEIKVTHQMIYTTDEECSTAATINLDEGVTMIKTNNEEK